MIGVFLVNNEGKIFFAIPPGAEAPEISAFNYDTPSGKAEVVFADGRVEAIAMDIAPEIRAAFAAEKDILVAELMDEHNNVRREYRVPLNAA